VGACCIPLERVSLRLKGFGAMPGTREGGLKAAKTNKERHGKDAPKRWGKKGGNPYLRAGGYKYKGLQNPL
jgi:hypothetical protein